MADAGLMQITWAQFLCHPELWSPAALPASASRGCWMTNNRYREHNKVSELCNQIPDTVSTELLPLYSLIWLDNWGTRNHVGIVVVFVVVVVFLWPCAQKRRQLCSGHNGQIGHVLQIIMAREQGASMRLFFLLLLPLLPLLLHDKKCTPSHLSLKLKSLP